ALLAMTRGGPSLERVRRRTRRCTCLRGHRGLLAFSASSAVAAGGYLGWPAASERLENLHCPFSKRPPSDRGAVLCGHAKDFHLVRLRSEPHWRVDMVKKRLRTMTQAQRDVLKPTF